jgi:group I intron endonuclease
MKIYKVTNKIDGKIYIGQTTQSITERWWQHCHRSPSQPHRSYIYNAIQKDGVENFTIECIATVDNIDALNALEIHYIKTLDTLAPKGYNLHPGGRGKTCHPDTKAKISATLKGRPIANRWTGGNKTPRTDETKAKIRASMTDVAQPWKYKKVVVLETGVIYESVNAAAKATGIARTTVSTLLRLGRQHKKSGQTFKFVEE